MRMYLWHKVSRIVTECSANMYYYGNNRWYRGSCKCGQAKKWCHHYDPKAQKYWAWWYKFWLKILHKLNDKS